MKSDKNTAAPTKHFTPEELASLEKEHLPRHIAIIPDGNRRWAAQANREALSGHQHGSKTVSEIVEAAAELGVKTLTIYAFSTENWQRTPQEVSFLMSLLEANIIHYRDQMCKHGVRLETIGDLKALPPQLQELLADAKARSSDGKVLTLVLAINYGSRDELRRVVQRMAKDCRDGRLAVEEIDEAKISAYLDTAPFGDPDLFIRTSGEMRISNFLLWQLCYTELYIPKVLWPDFTPHHLLEAVREFQNRKRRFGL